MGISLKRDNTLQAGRFSVEPQLTGLQLHGVKKVMNGVVPFQTSVPVIYL